MAVNNTLVARLHADVLTGDRAGRRDAVKGARARSVRAREIAIDDKESQVDRTFAVALVRTGVSAVSSISGAAQPAALDDAKKQLDQAAKDMKAMEPASSTPSLAETWDKLKSYGSKVLDSELTPDEVKRPIEAAARSKADRSAEVAQSAAGHAGRLAAINAGGKAESERVGEMLRELLA